MNIQTQYKAYNGSWKKVFVLLGFLSVISFGNILYNGNEIASILSKDINLLLEQGTTPIYAQLQKIFLPTKIAGSCLGMLYYGHNLYEQYRNNKAQERQIKIKLGGVEKVVDISPQYFDSCSKYNLFGFIASATTLGGTILDLNIPTLLSIISACSKMVSFDSYNDLTFTDHETGEIIPHQEIIFAD